jgi:hypothetical protein
MDKQQIMNKHNWLMNKHNRLMNKENVFCVFQLQQVVRPIRPVKQRGGVACLPLGARD